MSHGVRESELRLQVHPVEGMGIILRIGTGEWALPVRSGMILAQLIVNACSEADPAEFSRALVASFEQRPSN